MDDVYEPFHIRQRNLDRAGQPVLYKFDELPDAFKVEVFRVLEDVIGREQKQGGVTYVRVGDHSEPLPRTVWKVIGNAIADHLGYRTGESDGQPDFYNLMFRSKLPVGQVLSGIEIAFRVVERLPPSYQSDAGSELSPEQAIQAFNRRFRQHDLGYSFNSGQILRVDSQYLHTEVVNPALQLLTSAGFEGAQTLFLRAHKHFRHSENDDAILDAARAFESTMQHICDELSWEYPDRVNAKDLIRVVTDKGLFPSWHQNHMNSLRTLLEGLPTVRNKKSSHADTEGDDAPDEMAAFAIHLAASNIVFMVESFERLRRS